MVFEDGVTLVAVAVPPVSFESTQLQELRMALKSTSVRAGYRQVIDLSDDCSRDVQIV